MSSAAHPAEPAHSAEQSARRVGRSEPVKIGARIGIVANGVVHLLIAYLALQIAFGRSAEADPNGAMQTIAAQPFGRVLLWLVAVGFVAVALWRLTTAIWGYTYVEDRRKRLLKRMANAGRAVMFAVLAVLAARIASGGAGGGGGQQATAGVLGLPGGPVLIGLIGLGILIGGGVMIHQGWTKRFTEEQDLSTADERARRTNERTGQIGHIAKGIAFVILGVLVGTAAITYNPQQANGLDAALKTLAAQPFGPYLLTAIAIGIACYGVYCFFDARYHRV
ncbi:DUF1206 domain-containing protein [Pseudonocardia bannensis]|uniref:DUF1206 domain-containing protein n=1 Tax=Pseudonocardia bannensis TaxID=630973 RepID=A0A848DHI9_9PSEU|nr:DUF1206 domain-containing protein [Pseudonocardia bannensis]NMH92148.1 DUF1206 domain-containing protein [Pseudonocardia bannensis]